jgi:hypothetical protein
MREFMTFVVIVVALYWAYNLMPSTKKPDVVAPVVSAPAANSPAPAASNPAPAPPPPATQTPADPLAGGDPLATPASNQGAAPAPHSAFDSARNAAAHNK